MVQEARDRQCDDEIDLGLVQSDLMQKIEKENSCCYQFRRFIYNLNLWIVILLILANI